MDHYSLRHFVCSSLRGIFEKENKCFCVQHEDVFKFENVNGFDNDVEVNQVSTQLDQSCTQFSDVTTFANLLLEYNGGTVSNAHAA